MSLRRILGLLLASSMGHLAVAGSDLVCATHGGHAIAREASPPMAAVHHHGDAGQSGKEQCKIPVSANCCEAMTSCAANLALTAVVDEQSAHHPAARIVAFLADAPLTRILPPDPPPPKA